MNFYAPLIYQGVNRIFNFGLELSDSFYEDLYFDFTCKYA